MFLLLGLLQDWSFVAALLERVALRFNEVGTETSSTVPHFRVKYYQFSKETAASAPHATVTRSYVINIVNYFFFLKYIFFK